ncbi:MAG TPA: mycofactocin system transcriptional regulator [Acidimicrobiales bacterium]
MTTSTSHDRPGRPRSTDRAAVERTALELFSSRGFDETTVDEIAEAAGISRRTFFRYFDSKNDVVWGEFDALLVELDAWLVEVPPERPLLDALRDAVIRFNALPAPAVPAHRQRMSLILYVPALQAHSTLRYATWRAVIASHAARRLDQPEDSLWPQLVGHVSLAAALAAYEQWLARDDADLALLLIAAFDAIELTIPTG